VDGCRQGAALAPGEQCSVTVSFLPLAAGERQAELIATSRLRGRAAAALTASGLAHENAGVLAAGYPRLFRGDNESTGCTLAVDPGGNIWVAGEGFSALTPDQARFEVWQLDRQGNPVEGFPHRPDMPRSQLSFDPDGNLWMGGRTRGDALPAVWRFEGTEDLAPGFPVTGGSVGSMGVLAHDAGGFTWAVGNDSEPHLSVTIEYVPFRLYQGSHVNPKHLEEDIKTARRLHEQIQKTDSHRSAVLIGSQRANHLVELFDADLFKCDPFVAQRGRKPRVPFYLTYRERAPSIRAEVFRTSLVQNSKADRRSQDSARGWCRIRPGVLQPPVVDALPRAAQGERPGSARLLRDRSGECPLVHT
jgi:hypothetical protein